MIWYLFIELIIGALHSCGIHPFFCTILRAFLGVAPVVGSFLARGPRVSPQAIRPLLWPFVFQVGIIAPQSVSSPLSAILAKAFSAQICRDLRSKASASFSTSLCRNALVYMHVWVGRGSIHRGLYVVGDMGLYIVGCLPSCLQSLQTLKLWKRPLLVMRVVQPMPPMPPIQFAISSQISWPFQAGQLPIVLDFFFVLQREIVFSAIR